MKKQDLLNRITTHPEERVLLSRVWDLLDAARQRSIPQHTRFLTPEEQRLVDSLMHALGEEDYAFWGGYAEAQRRICVFLPPWLALEQWEAQPITAVRASWFAGDSLTHRDLLGGLMGLGIKRELVGDLLVDKESCDILVLSQIVPFLQEQFTSAGRVRLHLEEIDLHRLHIPVQQVRRIRDTVAGLRLDAVAAAGFSVSRAKMAEYIRSGRVSVNWAETGKTDLPMRAGDIISCRGLGKCRLAQVGQLSRKGRTIIELERYL